MSRIRQIKPSWWLDKNLRRNTSADAREFYIGLWQLADDAGILEWDVERIGAELYPYDAVSRRERNVAKWADALAAVQPESPHLVVWTCGHAAVPKMPGHQRIAGKQTFTLRDRHRECRSPSRREPPSATDSHGIGRVGEGTERVGRVGAPAREPDGSGAPTEFQLRVPRPGGAA